MSAWFISAKKKFILIFFISFFFVGCNAETIHDSYLSRCTVDNDCQPMFDVNCGRVGGCQAQDVRCVNNVCCGSYFISSEDKTDFKRKKYEDHFVEWLRTTGRLDVFAYEINVSDDFLQLECAYRTASESKRIENCTYFQGDFSVLCENVVYYEKASDEENEKYCQYIQKDQTLTNSCFSLIAKKRNDFSVCNKIADEKEKENCLNYIYTQLALKEEKSNFCLNIKNSFQDNPHQFSQDNCLIDVAEKTGQMALCDQVSEATVTFNGYSLSKRDDCRRRSAVTTSDVSYCRSITNNDQRWRCLWQIATDINQSTLSLKCSALLGEYFDRDECYERLINICQLLDYSNDNCISQVDRVFTAPEVDLKKDTGNETVPNDSTIMTFQQ